MATLYNFSYNAFNPNFQFSPNKRKSIVSTIAYTLENDIPTSGIVIDPDGGGDYTSLSSAESSERVVDSTDPVIFLCKSSSGTIDDFGIVEFRDTHWGTTHVQIWQESTNRHSGVFDESLYIGSGHIHSELKNFSIDGLQLIGLNTNVEFTHLLNGTTSTLRNCIIKNTTTTTDIGININTSPVNGTLYIYNNIIYSDDSSTYFIPITNSEDNITTYLENNTIVGSGYQAVIQGSNGNIIATNNIILSDNFGVVANLNAASDYNASNYSFGLNGSNDRKNQSFIFENFSNRDFRITTGDTAAQNEGTDSTENTFPYDIARNTWDSPRSIGANEPQ